MAGVEVDFDAWRGTSGLDAAMTIAAILGRLGIFERTWVAPSMDFPADGHFVSEPFTIEELEASTKDQSAAG